MALVKSRELRQMYEGMGPRACAQHLRESLQTKKLKPEDFSIRDLAEGLAVDRNGNPCGFEWVRAMDARRAGDSDTQEIMEAVDSGAFKNITGQLLITTVLDAYNSPAFIGSSLAKVVPTQLNGEKIPGITGLGDQAETVDELKPYPRAGVGEDWIETPVTTKRGLVVEVSKEAIFFDRTGQLLQRAAQVGESMGMNREKRIIDVSIGVTNNYKWKGTAYDTFQTATPWINVNATNPLTDYTNIDDSMQMFNALTDPATGEPIIVVPSQIVIHSSNRLGAAAALGFQQVNLNPNAALGTAQREIFVPSAALLKGTYEVLSSAFVDARFTAGSVLTTTWFFGDFRKAFAYMENWPVTVVQMPPNSYEEWNRDVVAGWKVSERGTVAVMDPRYVQRNTVA